MMHKPVRDVVGIIIVPLVVAAAIAAPAWVNYESDKHTQAILCQNALLTRTELAALRAIAREMGLPANFTIPPMPENCPEPVEAFDVTRCTESGTPGDDVRVTGRGKDVLCLLRGDDYGHGNGNGDILWGQAGEDALVGGRGADVLRGGNGDDKLFSVDGVRGNDTQRAGPGTDTCFADKKDKVKGCERTFRGASETTVEAFSDALYRSMTLGEEAQRELLDVEDAAPCDNPNPPFWC